ncbi:hypothetical protein JW921_03745 [Candidatus Fermentibacterales bacterium]|nr:hypothetical protein [Candidatus Fermentibacterales bacterium]
MSTKLFVGSLSWETTDQSLAEAFSAHGEVTEAKVIMDRQTGRSRGFGFVTFADEASARAAKDAMNNAMIDGRPIRVDFAMEKRDKR